MLSLQIMGLVSLLKARGAEGPGHTRSNVTLLEMERSPVVNFETFPIVLPYRGVADWLQVVLYTVMVNKNGECSSWSLTLRCSHLRYVRAPT